MKPESIARLLPSIYQRAATAAPESGDNVLPALLAVMETLQRSTEDFLIDRERFIEPWRADPDFLVQLARWVGLSPYVDLSAEPGFEVTELRELTRRAATLARNPGTAATIVEVCELVTGVAGFLVEVDARDGDGRRVPYHFRLVAPPALESRRAVLEKILAVEKPCFVTADIVFRAAEAPAEDREP